MKDLEDAKRIFLNEVDEETRAENEQLLQSWERDLIKNESYLEWKSHDITQELNKEVRKAYQDHAMTLANNRSLTEAERMRLWAKQDACLFILHLTDQDAKSAVDTILRDIRHALSA
jgi:hypothetical protein